jgi:hypothetical protein
MVPRDLVKFESVVDAKELLERLGIDTNDVTNGVYLPHTKTAAAGTSAQYHPAVHTEQYCINVKERLDNAVIKGGPTLEGHAKRSLFCR